MGLRDADTGKILWQGNDDLLALEDSEMQSSVKGNQFHLGGTYGTVQPGHPNIVVDQHASPQIWNISNANT